MLKIILNQPTDETIRKFSFFTATIQVNFKTFCPLGCIESGSILSAFIFLHFYY